MLFRKITKIKKYNLIIFFKFIRTLFFFIIYFYISFSYIFFDQRLREIGYIFFYPFIKTHSNKIIFYWINLFHKKYASSIRIVTYNTWLLCLLFWLSFFCFCLCSRWCFCRCLVFLWNINFFSLNVSIYKFNYS